MNNAMKEMFWLLRVTWKRRKGAPQEYIAVTSGGVLQVLFLHKDLCDRLKIPTSWVKFTLHTREEFERLAPELYRQWRRQENLDAVKALARHRKGSK